MAARGQELKSAQNVTRVLQGQVIKAALAPLLTVHSKQ